MVPAYYHSSLVAWYPVVGPTHGPQKLVKMTFFVINLYVNVDKCTQKDHVSSSPLSRDGLSLKLQVKVSLGTSIFPFHFGGLVPSGCSWTWTSKHDQNGVFCSKHIIGHIFILLPMTNTRGSGPQTRMQACRYQGPPTTLMVR